MPGGWRDGATVSLSWQKVRVTGMENLPTAAQENSAVVLAAKHQSTWETFAYPTLMPHPLAYVFKRELFFIPFFGWGIASTDMISIDRSKGTDWVMLDAANKPIDMGNVSNFVMMSNTAAAVVSSRVMRAWA